LENVNIVLSPEFYWLRVFDLPINSKKEVLEVLPSLFEEFIDVSNKKYYVKKLNDNKYLCFAYDESIIIEAIKNANISFSQINNIYFAQIELLSIVKSKNISCMKIDNICLGYMNDILVQVPITLQVNNTNDIDLSSLQLSKDTINIRETSQYISPKNLYILSFVSIFLSVVILAKMLVLNQLISNIPEQIDSIKSKYNMPSSTIQTNSILKRLNKISKTQIKLREAYKYIFDFKSKYGGNMISCEYKDKKFTIKFTNIKPKVLVDYIKKKYSISTVVKDNIVSIGFSI
jgi:hypothetical protein